MKKKLFREIKPEDVCLNKRNVEFLNKYKSEKNYANNSNDIHSKIENYLKNNDAKNSN